MSQRPSTVSILIRFKTSIIQLIDDLMCIFPREGDLVMLRVMFENQIPITVIADGFVIHVLRHRETIAKRNERFFLEDNNIFGVLDQSKVHNFKTLWQSEDLDAEDKEMVWRYFDAFITLITAYQASIGKQ